MTCGQKWNDLVKNLDRIEAAIDITGVSSVVSSLQKALDNVEKTIGDVSDLNGTTIVGALNKISSMIENLQNQLKEQQWHTQEFQAVKN